MSKVLRRYFNRQESNSTKKHHTRFRNDICNHWDLDYMSLEDIEERLLNEPIETTVARKKETL